MPQKALATVILLIAIPAYAQTYTLERVIDGNTIELKSGERVHLIGIDAPESKPNDKAKKESKRTGQDIGTINKMGQEATKFLNYLIKKGDNLLLEFDPNREDKKEKLFAYVFKQQTFEIGKSLHPKAEAEIVVKKGDYYWFINAIIIKSGYATPMTIPPNVKYADKFKKLHRNAIKNQRGLWKAACTHVEDCAFFDCSSFNSAIKSGYKSDCVDNQCMCMCYGCH